MVQLALAWMLTRSNVTSVLIGARNAEQVDQALHAEALELDEKLRADLAP